MPDENQGIGFATPPFFFSFMLDVMNDILIPNAGTYENRSGPDTSRSRELIRT